MLEIKGRFSCGKVKDLNGTKVLTLSNSDKDRDGNYYNSYYQMFLTEKAADLFTNEMKRKIGSADEYLIINISGYLKVSKNGNYTNLTIYPKSIEEYKKGDAINEKNLPF